MEHHPLFAKIRIVRSFTKQQPGGNDAATDNALRVNRQIDSELQFYDTTTVKFTKTTRGIRADVKIPPASPGGGIEWQVPKELDPSVDVKVDTLVYLSPQNPLVTTGLMDLVEGTLLQAPAGVWLCVQDVPAAASGQYNVPQPLVQGAMSGSPLKGDSDSPTVFWVQIAGISVCF